MNFFDPNGENATAILSWWTSTMWDFALAEPTFIGEIFYVAGFAILGSIVFAETLMSSKKIKDADNNVPLPDESDITVNINHIMENHHPNGGKGPQKDKFPKWMSGPVIEALVREAYNYAKNNYPDSIIKIQQGVRYYLEGSASGYTIRIWIDIIDKVITTAFPK